jgi:membrane-associated protease RseP (regulator of RpoE activity)
MVNETLKRFLKKSALAALSVSLLVGPAVAGEDEETKVAKRIVIKKVEHDCDGENCEEMHGIHHGDWGGGDGHHFIWKGHGDSVARGGFLGVHLTELTSELRGHFGVPEDAGVLVSKVVDDSPAHRGGVQVGDIITAVDGEAVSSARGLAKVVRSREDGETASLEIWRDGQRESLSVGIVERDFHGGHHPRMMVISCDEDEDCGTDFTTALGNFDCGGEEDCRIEVRCEEDGCDCNVNGESADCDELGVPRFHHHE